MAKRKGSKDDRPAPAPASQPPPTTPFEISDRATLQARLKPPARDPRAPLYRPLRIYTLDPSVSDRLGGVAVVQVPYEKLERGPIGALFEVTCDGAPRELAADLLDLDDPFLLLSSGLSPSPANGRFHLQMVYAVASLTYAAFKRALGREIAWAVTASPDGPLRLKVRPFIPGANAGYSREAGDLSFGYFKAGRRAAGFTVKGGLISTALSHDVVAHETTHALLDGLRSSFMEPTNVDVPAFHEGFADLVALFLHFTYVDVVERAIRESRGTLMRGPRFAPASTLPASPRSIPTCCRPTTTRRSPTIPGSSRTPSARCWCRRCSRPSSRWCAGSANGCSGLPESIRIPSGRRP
jgi:hypothetical protein